MSRWPNPASQKRIPFSRIASKTGRRVDDLQHLSGRGLLLQRLARLGNEPCVFDRDDRLRSEILQQRDLLFGEGADVATVDDNSTKEQSVLLKRNCEPS